MRSVQVLSGCDNPYYRIRKSVIDKTLKNNDLRPVFDQSKSDSRCYQTFSQIRRKCLLGSCLEKTQDADNCYQLVATYWHLQVRPAGCLPNTQA